ncbi:MAG: GtrA family protein [Muribaculaceae bacterium]|nr:GtrA family protein [Muribaculaceae bacterium]
MRTKHEIFLLLKATASSQIASWVDMGLSFALFSLTGLNAFCSKAIGAASGGVVNCYINYKWTFRPEGCSKRAVAIKYAIVWLGSMLLNSSGTALFTKLFIESSVLDEWGVSKDMRFMVAQLGVSFVVSVCWNLILQRYFVFRNVPIRKYVKKIASKPKS